MHDPGPNLPALLKGHFGERALTCYRRKSFELAGGRRGAALAALPPVRVV